MYFAPAVVAAFAASAYGATMTVLVGANNGLTFTPNNIQANPGDQVQFQFQNAVCATMGLERGDKMN